jgi:5-methylcytosine-specific restriction endonuclease McrA
MSQVFVVDTKKQPLNPVHPGRARLLLTQGKAAVLRRYPFTLILKNAVESPQVEPLRVKLDPGSKGTGLAIVNDASGEVVFAAELTHRGHAIKKALDARRAVRRSRRQRKTRYRQARFANRRKPKGWLLPSLESRIANVLTWTRRLMRVCPITGISMELVKFDLQQVENSAISGVEYQQGTLAGYEVREYLLEKWGRTCAYCDAKDVPLQVEHIACRARGGTNRVSNLCLACEVCNIKKGTQDVQVFLATKPDVLKRILAQAKAPLKDAAAVNTTRWALFERLKALGMPIECGSGGLTKFNRTMRGLSKGHWIDAACVGKSTPEQLHTAGIVPLLITAHGYGTRQMCLMDKHGFPRTKPKQTHSVKGYQTGDIVKAVVTQGKKVGTYVGRVAVRATGSFNITTGAGTIEGINHRYCHLIYRVDGYSYQFGRRAAFPPVT